MQRKRQREGEGGGRQRETDLSRVLNGLFVRNKSDFFSSFIAVPAR